MTGLLVHDWIESIGGAESVLLELCKTFPDAQVRTLWNDAGPNFLPNPIAESWLSSTPLRRSKALALPFMMGTWSSVKNAKYDWVLASSHAFAHHVDAGTKRKGVQKFTYLHTPARYLWEPELDQRGGGLVTRAMARPLRALDRRSGSSLENLAVNSNFVGERVRRVWGLDEFEVINPPVDIAKFINLSSVPNDDAENLLELVGPFLLTASRLVPYKGVDKAIMFAKRVGLPLVVVGAGPDKLRLKQLALEMSVEVSFQGAVSDEMLAALYSRCVAFCAFAIEDFGITPIEAIASGARVLANWKGGIAETVEDGVTGIHVDPLDEKSFAHSLERILNLREFKAESLLTRYSPERFRAEIDTWVMKGLNNCET